MSFLRKSFNINNVSSLKLGLIFACIFIVVFTLGGVLGLVILNKLHPLNQADTTFDARTITEGDFTFTVYDAHTESIEQPEEQGWQYLIVDVLFDNVSSEPVQLVPLLQVYVQDETAKTYTMTPASLEQPLIAGELAAGSKRRGQLSFVLPEGTHTVQLIIDTGWDNTAPVVFEDIHLSN